ncbi:MAG: malto-oligosyltrehalose trehalohydrolase, partial [Alkalispirochaetaceae bacterium]
MGRAGLPVDLTFGPTLEAEGTRFRLWAPSARRVELVVHHAVCPDPEHQKVGELVGNPLELPRDGEGWYESDLLPLAAGTTYAFRINGEIEVPDPASRFQPEGVHGPSEIIDLSAAPGAGGAPVTGRPWEQTVIYELHTGAFSREGTYGGITGALDHLVDLGVTAVELMPISAFPGRRNWGYDGVLPYAPAAAYGRPEELCALIRAAHDRELTLFLDVVYNHFGPDGNYLHLYAQPFFTDRFDTPWGAAIDFGVDEVRRFFLENALYWTMVYGFDGLRIDAVHAIRDESPHHFVDELAGRVNEAATGSGRGRKVHVVLENEENQASRIPPATGQWNDDIHHLLHVLITGEDEGYYIDYQEEPHRSLARALAEGFCYQGEPSRHRNGAVRGERSTALSPTAFVAFSHNHDQIGNRAMGERLTTLAGSSRVLEAVEALVLLSPQTPMLFMGEEWGSERPFLFFCDYQGDLASAVRQGRRREFAGFSAFEDESARARIPDPNDRETFRKSRIDWERRETEAGRRRIEFIRSLLEARKSRLEPLLSGISAGSFEGEADGAMRVRWPLGEGRFWAVYFNLTPAPRRLPAFDPPMEAQRVFPPPGSGAGA